MANVVPMPQTGEDQESFRRRFSANLAVALDHVEGMPAGYGRVTLAAQLLGVSANTMNAWLKGLSLPEIWRLPEIARRLDTTVDQLITGDFAAPGLIDEQYAMVALHGQNNLDDTQALYALPETLRFLRISRDMRLMRVDSPDMEGFAAPGDFVIYDPRARQIGLAGGVFVLAAYGQIVVRRACRTLRNQILLSCDHPHMPDETVGDADFSEVGQDGNKLQILGQVVGRINLHA